MYMKKFSVLALVASFSFLTACAEKQSGQPQQDSQEKPKTEATVAEKSEKTAEPTEKMVEPAVSGTADDKPTTTSSLNELQPILAKRVLKVPASISKPKARDFALVFCKQFPGFGANELLQEYMNNPIAFKEKYVYVKVVDDRPNGYIKCEYIAPFDNQNNETVEVCRWMRSNGHSLVGVWMYSDNEAGPVGRAYAFYDFDPATGLMTPDAPTLATVGNTIKRFSCDDVVMHLPQKGKDLKLDFLEFGNGDFYISNNATLHWTGNQFK